MDRRRRLPSGRSMRSSAFDRSVSLAHDMLDHFERYDGLSLRLRKHEDGRGYGLPLPFHYAVEWDLLTSNTGSASRKVPIGEFWCLEYLNLSSEATG